MNKSVLITGVSSGFGLAAAERLLERGYRVYGSLRRSRDAERVAQQLGSANFIPLIFDVTDHSAIADAAARVAADLAGSGLAGLVNNAGVAPVGPLEYTPVQQIRETFEVNVFGVVAVTQAFLPLLKRTDNRPRQNPPGRIVNISSTSGNMTFPMLGAYCASKHALESITDALRLELKRYRIGVVAIEPGSIRTPIWDKTRPDNEAPRFVDTEYGQLMEQLPALFERQLQRARPVSVVTDAIVRALESPRPRCRYPLDSVWYARKLLSDRILDAVIARQFPGLQGGRA